jgi:hypothetical protein
MIRRINSSKRGTVNVVSPWLGLQIGTPKASLVTCATWVCPPRNHPWRPPAGHRSGRAASCAAATASRPTRAKRRRPRDRRGHPVRRSSADRVTSALRLEISPEGPGFSSEFGPVRPLGDTSGATDTSPLPRPTGPEGFCTDYGPRCRLPLARIASVSGRASTCLPLTHQDT